VGLARGTRHAATCLLFPYTLPLKDIPFLPLILCNYCHDLCSLTAQFDCHFLVQSTQLFTGESEHAVSQLSFHPSDPDLLCTLGESGLSLWHVDKHAGQSQLQQVPVQISGGSKIRAVFCREHAVHDSIIMVPYSIRVCHLPVYCARAKYTHSTAQHSTAQHSMAKACSAQPSIALYSCPTAA
jgi:hypothetical protein